MVRGCGSGIGLDVKRGVGIAGVGVLLMVGIAGASGWWKVLFSARYLPHRFCYLADPGLVWTNVTTDGLIAASYAAIFGCLIWIAAKLRRVEGFREYLWIFISFGLFIGACGATHAMEVVTVWWPVYPFSALVKVVCALASVPTAVMLMRATPLLAKRIPHVMDSLTATQQERDDARGDLALAIRKGAECEKAEYELKVVNERLNHIMDSTSEAILKVDREWVLQYANRRAFEVSPELAIGKGFWEIFPRWCRPIRSGSIAARWTGGGRFSSTTFMRRTRSGFASACTRRRAGSAFSMCRSRQRRRWSSRSFWSGRTRSSRSIP